MGNDRNSRNMTDQIVAAELSVQDQQHLRAAIKVASLALEHGNHPFGALLVDANGQPLLAAENSVVSHKDPTAHAEMNLVRAAVTKHADDLRGATLFASAEPCPMCASAIVWANIRRVVFGLGMDRIYEIFGESDEQPSLRMHARTVFDAAPYPIEVLGPALEDDAAVSFEGFAT